MTTCFDSIIIGAGPCALATLSALPSNHSIAIISGSEPSFQSPGDVHPKIRVESLESGQQPGVAGRVEPLASKSKALYATAITGGLANYWGQQLIHNEANDPYDTNLFKTYSEYLNECSAIADLFTITGGDAYHKRSSLPDGFVLREPKLLSGTLNDPKAGLKAMRATIDDATKSHTCFQLRAERISRSETNMWSVHLSDGSIVTGRKIWLAAGVIGTAQLIMNSVNGLLSASFKDHAPYMAYVSGLKYLLKGRVSQHFNAYTLELIEKGRCEVFASIYDMSRAELNLVLGSASGMIFPFLRGVRSPSIASLIQPVQIWTSNSFSNVKLDLKGTRYSSSKVDVTPDDGLEKVTAAITSLGGKIWHHSRTPAGLGFHYHDLQMKLENGQLLSINSLLKQWSNGEVICSDASVLREIGLRPHTLTAMAAARCLVKQHCAID
ncbi:hypothetical protein IBT49_01250 [Erwinia sp. S63]|uniref:hypothetical protein n=1 Tax=Erwinia sp. S63 TaxID=2769341 RepID=UPI00190DE857|nr:hypothetical protein [Erwinia sp. S63]MBK0094589.1 hypothetical protein [Erwinia sp. S63]